jgi:hypothetical protein
MDLQSVNLDLSCGVVHLPGRLRGLFLSFKHALLATVISRCWLSLLLVTAWATAIYIVDIHVRKIAIQSTLLPVYVTRDYCLRSAHVHDRFDRLGTIRVSSVRPFDASYLERFLNFPSVSYHTASSLEKYNEWRRLWIQVDSITWTLATDVWDHVLGELRYYLPPLIFVFDCGYLSMIFQRLPRRFRRG